MKLEQQRWDEERKIIYVDDIIYNIYGGSVCLSEKVKLRNRISTMATTIEQVIALKKKKRRTRPQRKRNR